MSIVARLLTATLILAISASAQETAATCGTSSLYGRIKSSDPDRPLSKIGTVSIVAFAEADAATKKHPWDTEEAQGDSYCVKVPVRTVVFLHFQGDGIDPLDSLTVNTGVARKRHSWPMPLAELDPIGAMAAAQSRENQDARQRRQIVRAKLLKHQASVD